MYTLHQTIHKSSNITTFISCGHKTLHTSTSSFCHGVKPKALVMGWSSSNGRVT